MIGLHRLIRVSQMSQSGSQLIPKTIVVWVLFQRFFKKLNSHLIVSINEMKHTQTGKKLWVLSIAFFRYFLEILDHVVYCEFMRKRLDLIFWVVLDPGFQEIHSLILIEIIGTTDSKSQQHVKILRVFFVSLEQTIDCSFIVVIFLMKSAQQMPCLRHVFLLKSSFQSENSLCALTLVNQFLSSLERITCSDVFILFLVLVGCLFELVLEIFLLTFKNFLLLFPNFLEFRLLEFSACLNIFIFGLLIMRFEIEILLRKIGIFYDLVINDFNFLGLNVFKETQKF